MTDTPAISPLIIEDQNRIHANLAIECIDRRIPQALEQFSSASKWLTGSLFALNGAGALATINVLTKLDNPIISATIFSSGLLFVMMSAVVVQEASQRNIDMAEDWRFYWAIVQRHGIRCIDTEAEKITRYRVMNIFYYLAPCLGWISGFLFFLGVYTLSSSIERQSRDDAASCKTIKNHMLTKKRNRSDAIALYQALNCNELL